MLDWIQEIFRRPRSSKPKRHRPNRSVKLMLEGLEDRTLMSASTVSPPLFSSPMTAVASPPAVPAVQDATSPLVATMD